MSLIVGTSYGTIDYINSRARNTQEAAARPARVRFYVDVTGSGGGEATIDGLNFGALIMEEPTFSYGLVALENIPAGQIPLATAVVLSWISNDNGIYTGANMGFRLQTASNAPLRFKYSLTFEGSTLRSTANTGMAVSPDTSVIGQSPTLFRR